jgi:hypothetical protein
VSSSEFFSQLPEAQSTNEGYARAEHYFLAAGSPTVKLYQKYFFAKSARAWICAWTAARIFIAYRAN